MRNLQFLDAFEDLTYKSPSGAEYCPRTSFVLYPEGISDAGSIISGPEFIHETFHHVSSMLFGAGMCHSSMRYTRSRHLRSLVLNYEPLRDSVDPEKMAATRFVVDRPTVDDLQKLLDFENDDVPPILYEIVKLKVSQRTYMHMSTIEKKLISIGESPVSIIIEGAISSIKELCHRYGYSPPWMNDYQIYGESLSKSLGSNYYLPYSKKYKRCIDTFDLMEAFSICADVSMTYESVSPCAAEDRLHRISTSQYLIVIDAIFNRFSIPVTASNISRYAVGLLLMLEWALDSDFVPLSSWIADEFTWEDVYPPARLNRAIKVLEKSGIPCTADGIESMLEANYKLSKAFKRASSWIAVHRRRDMFGLIDKFVELSMAEKIDTEIKPICPLDYYILLYTSFHHFKNSSHGGVSIALKSGNLNDICYIRPPVVFDGRGRVLTSRDSLSKSIFGPSFCLFSNFICMDDYVFGKKPKFFPFNLTNFQSGEWYHNQMLHFLHNLETMKRHYTKVPDPHPFQ